MTSLLAGHLAAGGLFVTAMLSIFHRVPEGFLKFCIGSSAGVAAAAGLLQAGSGRIVWWALVIVAGVWYASVRGPRARLQSLLGWLTAAAAVAAPAGIAWLSSEQGPWLAAGGGVSSALLLGAVAVTMVLGHWYLVDTSLSIAPLRDAALWFAAAVTIRWIAVVGALVYGGWEVLGIGRTADLFFSTHALFFLFRSLMGLVAPLLLAGLIWQTVKMRSTQSATGLLYVALVLVLFGELVAHFLRFATGYPL